MNNITLAVGQKWRDKEDGQVDTLLGCAKGCVEYRWQSCDGRWSGTNAMSIADYEEWAAAHGELISEGTPAKRPVAPADPIPHIAVPPFPPEIDELLAELEAALPAKSKCIADKFAERVATWAMAQGALAMIGGGK